MEPFTAIVLAGGASSRMGRAKALLPFGAATLIERIVASLRPIAAEIVVVSGSHVRLPPLPQARVIEDETPLQGPLAGIVHGLEAAQRDLSFVCGCDHPFLAAAVVRLIAESARENDGAVATWNGVAEPLVAAYRKRIGAVAAEMLAGGERRASVLVERSHAVLVPEADLRRADPSGRTFIDVDTPEAYREALQIFYGHRSP
jgi:molybdopterin-guanine dinucleotide biosynthesis protein A